jgi:hypothetical protein
VREYVEIRVREDLGEIVAVDGSRLVLREGQTWLLPERTAAVLIDAGSAVPASPEAAELAQSVAENGVDAVG